MNMLKPAFVTLLFVVTIFSFCDQEEQISFSYGQSLTMRTLEAYNPVVEKNSIQTQKHSKNDNRDVYTANEKNLIAEVNLCVGKECF